MKATSDNFLKLMNGLSTSAIIDAIDKTWEILFCGVCLKALRDAYDDCAIDGDGWGIIADAAAWMANHVVNGGEMACGRYDG